ncbi:fibroblast growth factor receptor 3 isoform X1 [Hydra vulgaris]|uniref:fibroblast growth factor receptor 3 isoform X1 n=1 Tax=Hydra vulgaris TaxID=6087 RepID=UPI001F5FEE10|nr:fibroblast growth factor receptor 3 [Hydra vulgaris]
MLKFLAIVLCFSKMSAIPSDGILKFISTAWIFGNNSALPPMKFMDKDDSLIISCETNDPDAKVNLWRKKSGSSPAVSAQEFFKDRLSEKNQTFIIKYLTVTDSGIYYCKASNDQTQNLELKLGDLVVSNSYSDRIPEIFPQPENNTLAIESNGNKNITCKTIGAAGLDASYLTWYKIVDNVPVPVDKSQVVRQEDSIQSQVIDIEILMFKNYQASDGGKFVCERKVRDKKATSTFINIVLEPDRAPVVQFPFQNSSLIVLNVDDKSFQISCLVSGSPKPKRQWLKDDKVVQNCIDDSEFCHLYINGVSYPKDNGLFICVGENTVGKGSKSVFIQVNVPIKLKKQQQTAIANTHDLKAIYCEVQKGNPLPVFRWEVKSKSCDTTNPRCDIAAEWSSVLEQYPEKTDRSSFSYIFSEESEASYRCLAQNDFSKDESIISVVRTDTTAPEFSFYPFKNEILNEEDKFYLKCEASQLRYESSVLKKGDQVLNAKSTINSMAMVLEYEISSVSMADAGNYECIGKLKQGNVTKLLRNIVVQKLIKPSINNFNDLTFFQNVEKNKELRCNASGNPQPKVTWKRNGILLNDIPNLKSIESCKHSTDGIYIMENNVLMLCNLKFKEHDGMYECTASNKVGVVSKVMNLTIKAKPAILKSEVVFMAPSSLQLTCVSLANPPANVTWYKLNQKNQTFYLSSQMVTIQYTIENVDSRNSDSYMCTAANELGKIENIVTVKPSISDKMIGSIKRETLIGVLVPAILILLVAFIGIVLYRNHLKNKYALYLAPDKDYVIDPDRTLFEQSGELPYDTAWEFPRDRLKFIKTLGSGAFGEVWLAEAEGINDFRPRDLSTAAIKQRKLMKKQSRRYTNLTIRYKKNINSSKIELEKTMVAVKTLKEDASEAEYKDLATELKILIHLGEHKNIVNLLGACTTKGEKLHVILECCPGGNLLNFLRSKREVFKPFWFKKELDMENEFTFIDLLMIAYQVSKGMDFLQSRKCVHRDLAARNVLVGPDYVMKVADFGLARDIYKNEFYLKETTGLLPVKWMAPESLFDKIYTSNSDVWSYGILLWEVYTLGGSPYPGLPTEELFSFLEDGRRMDCPEICPKAIYEIMLDCWKKSPYDRPLFAQITERLNNVLKQNVASSCDYLLDSDYSNGNNYLTPANFPRKKSSDYLMDEKISSKKRNYVPEPNQRLLAEEEDMTDSALPPLPSYGDGYTPMNAETYKFPRNFKYDKEVCV